MSFLPVIAAADNFRVESSQERLVPWTISSSSDTTHAIGLLRPEIIDALLLENNDHVARGCLPSWTLEYTHPQDSHRLMSVRFADHLDTPAKRTEAVRAVCERWRDTGRYSGIIGPKKWRNELYAVYYDPFGPRMITANGKGMRREDEDELARSNSNYAFSMERSACALFGVVTYGVHMNVYEKGEDGRVRLWVPRRSKTKQTWPGMLDNSVAGGLEAGTSPLECIVKESREEASLEEDVVRQHVVSVGAVSYLFRTASGWIQPEFQYTYDLAVPARLSEEERRRFIPRPLDGEVDSFELLDIDAAVAEAHAGKFKPNCALVLVDFLIRHGYITAENEPRFLEIQRRIHGDFGYERWLAL